MSLRQLQSYLGHSSIEITVKYLHLTSVSETKAQEALARLFAQVIEQRTSNLEQRNPDGRKADGQQGMRTMEGAPLPLPTNLPHQLPSQLPTELPTELPTVLPTNLSPQLPQSVPQSRQWKRWKVWKGASRH